MPFKTILMTFNMINFLFLESLHIILNVVFLINLFYHVDASCSRLSIPLKKMKKTLNFWLIFALYKLFFILKMNMKNALKLPKFLFWVTIFEKRYHRRLYCTKQIYLSKNCLIPQGFGPKFLSCGILLKNAPNFLIPS